MLGLIWIQYPIKRFLNDETVVSRVILLRCTAPIPKVLSPSQSHSLPPLSTSLKPASSPLHHHSSTQLPSYHSASHHQSPTHSLLELGHLTTRFLIGHHADLADRVLSLIAGLHFISLHYCGNFSYNKE